MCLPHTTSSSNSLRSTFPLNYLHNASICRRKRHMFSYELNYLKRSVVTYLRRMRQEIWLINLYTVKSTQSACGNVLQAVRAQQTALRRDMKFAKYMSKFFPNDC